MCLVYLAFDIDPKEVVWYCVTGEWACHMMPTTQEVSQAGNILLRIGMEICAI
jgi:3-mercaptopyruvate sulfurtransferase SseA